MLKHFERNGTIIALCGHKKKSCNSCQLKKIRQKGKILICTSNPEKYQSFNPPPDPPQTADMLVGCLAVLTFLADIAFNAYKRFNQSRPVTAKAKESREDEEEWVV